MLQCKCSCNALTILQLIIFEMSSVDCCQVLSPIPSSSGSLPLFLEANTYFELHGIINMTIINKLMLFHNNIIFKSLMPFTHHYTVAAMTRYIYFSHERTMIEL